MALHDISTYYGEDLALREEISWILSDAPKKPLGFLFPFLEQYGIRSAIELGCASGILAAHLPRTLDYLGVDANEWFIKRAIHRNRDIENRSFAQADVRNFICEQSDLSMAWSFMKHFALDEWDDILGLVLRHGHYAAFDVQLAEKDFDNGVDYHHVFVTRPHVERAIRKCGYEVVQVETWNSFEVEGLGKASLTAFVAR